MWGLADWGSMIWGGALSLPVPMLGSIGLLVLATGLLVTAGWTHKRWPAVSAVLLLLAIPIVVDADLTLPNTFTNGTVADANEVNANFTSIQDDFAKLVLVASGPGDLGTTVPVPQAAITHLCQDEDGCVLRLASRDRSNPGDFPSFPMLIHMRSVALNQRWRTDTGSGTDGNGSIEHPLALGSDCFFTDGAYNNFTPLGDSAVGMGLLVWNGAANPTRSCVLTITD